VDCHSIIKSLLEALSNPSWQAAMQEEMAALERHET